MFKSLTKKLLALSAAFLLLVTSCTTQVNPADLELRVSDNFLQYRVSETASWTNVLSINDIRGTNGTNGTNGVNGLNGVGITSMSINAAGELVVVLSNGTTQNLGRVVGAQGPAGLNGVNGVNGSNGAPGIMGPQGPKGDAGEMFVTLEDGATFLANPTEDYGYDDFIEENYIPIKYGYEIVLMSQYGRYNANLDEFIDSDNISGNLYLSEYRLDNNFFLTNSIDLHNFNGAWVSLLSVNDIDSGFTPFDYFYYELVDDQDYYEFSASITIDGKYNFNLIFEFIDNIDPTDYQDSNNELDEIDYNNAVLSSLVNQINQEIEDLDNEDIFDLYVEYDGEWLLQAEAVNGHLVFLSTNSSGPASSVQVDFEFDTASFYYDGYSYDSVKPLGLTINGSHSTFSKYQFEFMSLSFENVINSLLKNAAVSNNVTLFSVDTQGDVDNVILELPIGDIETVNELFVPLVNYAESTEIGVYPMTFTFPGQVSSFTSPITGLIEFLFDNNSLVYDADLNETTIQTRVFNSLVTDILDITAKLALDNLDGNTLSLNSEYFYTTFEYDISSDPLDNITMPYLENENIDYTINYSTMHQLFADDNISSLYKYQLILSDIFYTYDQYMYLSLYGDIDSVEFSNNLLDLVELQTPDYSVQFDDEYDFFTDALDNFGGEASAITLYKETFRSLVKFEEISNTLDISLEIITNFDDIISKVEAKDFSEIDFGQASFNLGASSLSTYKLTSNLLGLNDHQVVDSSDFDRSITWSDINDYDYHYVPRAIGSDDYGFGNQLFYGFTGEFDGNNHTLFNWKATNPFDEFGYEFIDVEYYDSFSVLESIESPSANTVYFIYDESEYYVYDAVNDQFLLFDNNPNFNLVYSVGYINHFGLFGVTGNAEIRNLTLEDFSFKFIGNINDVNLNEVGLLIGHAHNTIVSNVNIKSSLPQAVIDDFVDVLFDYLDNQMVANYPYNIESLIKTTGIQMSFNYDSDFNEGGNAEIDKVGGVIGRTNDVILINVNTNANINLSKNGSVFMPELEGTDVAGLIGEARDYLTIYNSQVTSALIAGRSNVGGLIGEFNSDNPLIIENSFVFGTYLVGDLDVGGLISEVEGTHFSVDIINSYFVGSIKSYQGNIAGFIEEIDLDTYFNIVEDVEININNSYAIIIDAWLYGEDKNVSGFISEFLSFVTEEGNIYEAEEDNFDPFIKVNINNSFAGLNYIFIQPFNNNTITGVTELRTANVNVKNVFFSQLPNWYADEFNPDYYNVEIEGTLGFNTYLSLDPEIYNSPSTFNKDMIPLKDSRFVNMFLNDDFYFDRFWNTQDTWDTGENGFDIHDNPMFEIYSEIFGDDIGSRYLPQLKANSLSNNTITDWKYRLYQRIEQNSIFYLINPKTTLFLENMPNLDLINMVP